MFRCTFKKFGLPFSFFVSDGRNSFFDPKRITNEMFSSLVNVSDDASRKPEEFGHKDIEVFVSL